MGLNNWNFQKGGGGGGGAGRGGGGGSNQKPSVRGATKGYFLEQHNTHARLTHDVYIYVP